MKELIEHIEALLLTNDCVIVPDFGGFVAFNVPARWMEEEGLFAPPMRTVGFNSQLKLNDGLVVQAYMSAYGTTFPDASKRVARAVRDVKRRLMSEGKIELQGLGTLRVAMNGSCHFVPFMDGLNSPSLYGLGEFHFQPLAASRVQNPVMEISRNWSLNTSTSVESQSEGIHESGRRQENVWGKRVWCATVASAAAVALFFLLSTPVKNVGMGGKSYQAQIVSSQLFVKQSVANTKVVKDTLIKEVGTLSGNDAAVCTKPVEDLISSGVKASVETLPEKNVLRHAVEAESQNRYFVVVSALATQRDAQEAVDRLRKEGYSTACLRSGSRVHKICIASYENEEEAMQGVRKFRAGKYEDAWLLKK